VSHAPAPAVKCERGHPGTPHDTGDESTLPTTARSGPWHRLILSWAGAPDLTRVMLRKRSVSLALYDRHRPSATVASAMKESRSGPAGTSGLNVKNCACITGPVTADAIV
jgi:hypothetical protein